MKWTRDQLTEASVTLVKIKSQLAVIEKKFTDAKQDKTDGLKLTWPNSWVHIRKSNTEPIIRIYAEASSEDDDHKLVDSIKRCIL